MDLSPGTRARPVSDVQGVDRMGSGWDDILDTRDNFSAVLAIYTETDHTKIERNRKFNYTET